MSTNYYLHTEDGEEIHLGKYANGHPFMFRGDPDRGVVTYAAWVAQLQQGEIRTEAGTPVPAQELLCAIRQARSDWARFHWSQPRQGQVDDEGHRFSLYEFC